MAGGEANGSVLRRMAAILNLFAENSPVIQLADVERVLKASAATAYRYVAELCESGMLCRVSGGYSPGPKILELEFLISRFDPLLVAARDVMDRLSAASGCHVLLCRLFGQRLVNVYHAKSGNSPDLNFIVGRKMPFFRGSQSRMVLATLDRRRLRRIFDGAEGDPARDWIGRDWASFAGALARNRRDGFYVSREELDPNTTGIAVPVVDPDLDVLGSLVLAFPSRSPPLSEPEIVTLLRANANDITRRLRRHSPPDAGTAGPERTDEASIHADGR